MAFIDKAKDFMDKSVEVSKQALSKAGEAIQDFGDKSVLKIEGKKIQSKIDDLKAELGSIVYQTFVTDKAETISSSDEKITSILDDISKLNDELAKNRAELEKV